MCEDFNKCQISSDDAKKIINNLFEVEEGKCEPKGYFWTIENGQYIGIDNSDGCCWVEEFNTAEQCKEWLFNE